MRKYPEFDGRELYITGESYAGIYVPTLSALLVDDSSFNFQGFAVGNSVTDRVTMNNGFPYFAWARGLFGTELWDGLLDYCCVERNASNCVFYENGDVECTKLYAQVYNVQWNLGINPYNLYQDCYGGVPDSRGVISETETDIQVIVPELALHMDNEHLQQYEQLVREMKNVKNVTVRIPCSDTSDRETYLNRADVREALHVSDKVDYWLPCSSSLTYARQYENVRAEYYKILDAGHRILSYYGDLDMACDHLSGMWFAESLGVPLSQEFKQWLYPDDMGYNQIAGFVEQFENFKFVSLKGAGHFVPTDKELPAFMMFQKFLNGEDY
jgi:cathepsin A (carboxypeptidase C)